MDRTEKIGLGVAIAGHAILFGLLSVGFLATPNPAKLQQQPIDISLVPDVALEATAPQSVTPPAESVAPDVGAPEDAAPPPPEEAEPEPTPAPPAPAPAPQPKPKPAPQKPAPVAKPAPPKPEPKPVPRPAPVAKPQPKPKPAPVKPAPAKPAPAAPAKSAPSKSTAKPAAAAPSKSTAKPTAASSPSRTAASSSAKAKPAAAKGTGSTATATNAKPRGSRLGDNFLKGLSDQPSPSKSEAPRAAKIDARAMASIVQAIARQIQPCADRQVNPGPGANQIVTKLNLRLNQDGTLAATPRQVGQTGVDDENRRYAQRVTDLGIAAFKGCSPLKLPAEFYSTPNGGWNNINYSWQLR
jgi:hypothetical protein